MNNHGLDPVDGLDILLDSIPTSSLPVLDDTERSFIVATDEDYEEGGGGGASLGATLVATSGSQAEIDKPVSQVTSPDLDTKSTERQHSPVYDNDLPEPDLTNFDVYDYDYLDTLTGTDDNFYYTDWEHSIYDDVVLDKTGKRVKGAGTKGDSADDENVGNVTVNYNVYPSRPKQVHPNINNVQAKTEAKPCNRDRCKLPDCLCGKTKIKGQ